MSYILDALKKLEQDKTRKYRTTGKINISGELFANDHVRPAEGRRLKTIVLVSVAILATFVVTWFLLKGSGKRSRVATEAIVVLPVPGSSSPAIIPAPPTAPPQSTPPLTQMPAAVASPKTMIPVPVSAVSPQVALSPPPDEDEDGRRSRRRKTVVAVPTHSSTVARLNQVQAPADIKVSGIAWQDERSARRAVVNGFLLREGAFISGAKITEILQDRVKFSLSGSVFEVSLISAGITGGSK